MKIFKILKKVFQAAAAILFMLSIVLCGVIREEVKGGATELAETAFLSTVMTFGAIYLFAMVGIFLVSAANETAQKVGHGMTISSFAIGLLIALLNIEESTAAIVMLLAVIMLALYYLCVFIIYIMKKSGSDAESPNEDIRIIRIREWKQIMDEGIITKEEFESKRCQILGIKNPAKAEIPEKTERV